MFLIISVKKRSVDQDDQSTSTENDLLKKRQVDEHQPSTSTENVDVAVKKRRVDQDESSTENPHKKQCKFLTL